MTAALHLDQVSRTYGGLQALHPLSLTIPAGERHAVIGPNGAGKSTLLSLIAGALRLSSGRLRLHGADITRLSPESRARAGIGRTHQHPAIWPNLTVAQHLVLATRPGPRTADRISAAARGVNALNTVGLQDRAAVPAAALSYGERRLLELAIALAGAPRLLLLDEPSAGLSSGELHRLRDVLTALPEQVTTVIVDHHLDLVFDIADTVTVLHQGQLLATGPAAAIRTDARVNAVYAATGTAPTRRPRAPQAARPALTVRLPAVGYGTTLLTDISLDVHTGEAAAVVGANGAGKTTLLNAISGLHHGVRGTVLVGGHPTAGMPPHHAVDAGLATVPQGRRLWPRLTVAEHLVVAHPRRRAPSVTKDQILALFPALADRLHHRGSQLSGGEQQMLSIARALTTSPNVLLLDEPAEGLAPAIVGALGAALNQLIDGGLAVLLAEPAMQLGHHIADTVVVLADGTITAHHLTRDLRTSTSTVPEGEAAAAQ
ncbi:ATP-binding cassette domain-containing protein [Catellatospora sp. NPDC049133]|uniref:ATP-binding cassette domain-containing protein n=1 Tax=Catellatospora sp. NPDC049133 TaxID=3155499 RepID=UPI0033FC1C02